MSILLVMFILGLLLGFVGAGGAGVVIAVLTTVFNIPIHMALGTSLSAMACTTLSGAYSHFREKNVIVRLGISIGGFGAAGAFIGAKISAGIAPDLLHILTAMMLFTSAALIFFKVFYLKPAGKKTERLRPLYGKKFWGLSVAAGLFNGILSGTFGVGATPFIQLTLLFFFGTTLFQSVGTTMLIILPIAIMGGIGYLTSGLLDLRLFIEVVIGLMTGAYIGAKFTKKLPVSFLKVTMVAIPLIGGIMLIHR